MYKKISLILGLIFVLTLVSSCGRKVTEETMKKNDPITDYDRESTAAVDGNEDGMLVKEKKFEYNDANVEILYVENLTDKAYTVKIDGHFLNEDGDEIGTLSKTFDGYPAGYQNHFVFQPEIKYDKFTYELTVEDFDGTVLAGYLHAPDEVKVELCHSYRDGHDELYTDIIATFFPIYSTYSGILNMNYDLVIFNSSGDIYMIRQKNCGNIYQTKNESEYSQKSEPCISTDILWAENNKVEIPEELQNLSVIAAVTSVWSEKTVAPQ